MDIIFADYTTKDILGVVDFYEADFEIGDGYGSNTWQLTVPPEMIRKLPDNALIYIPDTEYGGIYRRKGVDYVTGLPTIGGYTWRGLLQKHVRTVYSMTSYDVGSVLWRIIYDQIPLFLCLVSETGVHSRWRGARHVDLLEASTKATSGTGYRMNIAGTTITVAPVKTWTEGIYEDFHVRYSLQMEQDFVNHLICLGEGELGNRLVQDIYADATGKISPTRVFSGNLEVAEVFDYSSADADTLAYYGTRRMEERLKEAKKFQMVVDTERIDIEIGDKVQVYDEATGLTMTAPITGKVLHITGDIPRIEYQLSNEIEIEEAQE